MAISLALMDSSNGTRTPTNTKRLPHAHAHVHLRSVSHNGTPASLRKSPPTCTLSLASVLADDSASNPAPWSMTQFPAVPFPHQADDDSGACGGDTELPPPPRRPRARTSHVATPKRTPSRPSNPNPKPTSNSPSVRPRPKSPGTTAKDLRFAALVERSITLRLGAQSSEPNDLDAQDELLAARLRSSLARAGHGPRRAASPPRVLAIPARPPSVGVSLLFSGSAGSPSDLDSPALRAPASMPLRVAFVASSRARSGSASSGSLSPTAQTLDMSALVAASLLRRHDDGRRVLPGSAGPHAAHGWSRTPSPLAQPCR
ncbi:hypothetical protein DFH07DRAFT_1056038 [Mycena maculata]|uniref:Uncharacterized protein n=1 Tax=Mycena maculata TaxID=230809 RepID=A0AAD7NX35_9AGAR|nr:hypothetical protein DFH07DRAFT_1056038 [Mycena maculata]